MTNKILLFFLCIFLSVRAGESSRDVWTAEDVRLLAAGMKRARGLQGAEVQDVVEKITADEEREKVVSDKDALDELPRAAWLPEDYELVAAAAKRACTLKKVGVNKRQKKREYLARKREQSRKYREEHAEEIKECRRTYREKHKEEIKERNRRYCEQNKEAIKAWHHQYYVSNKEKLRKYNRKYFNLHKEAIQEQHAKYRAAHREKERERVRRYRERVKMSRLEAVANKDDGSGE